MMITDVAMMNTPGYIPTQLTATLSPGMEANLLSTIYAYGIYRYSILSLVYAGVPYTLLGTTSGEITVTSAGQPCQ